MGEPSASGARLRAEPSRRTVGICPAEREFVWIFARGTLGISAERTPVSAGVRKTIDKRCLRKESVSAAAERK